MDMPVAATYRRSPAVLFARQHQLLQLLDSLGGAASKLDFQKLLFLYCQEFGPEAPYDFVPYKFGAFSFTSYADRRKLIERGLLEDDDSSWCITDEGRDAIGRSSDMQLSDFARRHTHLRGDGLVAEAYRRYPYFATRSEIVERVLGDDPVALARVRNSCAYPSGGTSLHTIGYEGHTLESYLNKLLGRGITLLCDVRRNPISRKYGFSKSTLARGCDAVSIRYIHLPELGIASAQRRGLDTQADYDALFDDYERIWLPNQGNVIERMSEWIGAGERLALTCYEHLPHQCHRHCVAEALEARIGKGMKASHL